MATIDLDVVDYDRLVAALYAAALDSKRWGPALRQFQQIFEANYVTLILRMPEYSGAGLMIAVGEAEGVSSGELSYMAYPYASTPFVDMPADRVFTVDDVMREPEWRGSAYYRDWCMNHDVFHVMGADISTPDAGRLRFRITRPESAPRFSAAEKARCEALLPHLRQALLINNKLGRREHIGALYARAMGRLAVGTVVLDESGQIIEQNLAAREVLARADGLKVVGNRLEASYPSINRELQQLIRKVLTHRGAAGASLAEAMSVSRPSGQHSLGLVVESVVSAEWAEGRGQPAAVVYIRDAAGKSMTSVTAAKQLFNLTPSETALAMELANGLSLEEAAEALDIRRNTARAHLRSIFSKTGVRRQTELVRIMLNSVAALSGR